MISTEPILLIGSLSVGEIKNGYQVNVENTTLIFDDGASVSESELILE